MSENLKSIPLKQKPKKGLLITAVVFGVFTLVLMVYVACQVYFNSQNNGIGDDPKTGFVPADRSVKVNKLHWLDVVQRGSYVRPKCINDTFLNAIAVTLFQPSSFVVKDPAAFCPTLFFHNGAECTILPTYHQLAADVRNIVLNAPPERFHIIVDGEPNMWAVKDSDVDLIITTKQSVVKRNRKAVHLSYMAMYCKMFERVPYKLALTRIANMVEWNGRSFMFFAYSNASLLKYPGVSARGRFFDLARKRFGPCVRNIGRARMLQNEKEVSRAISGDKFIARGFHLGDNLAIAAQFQFAVCFENMALEGYVSEKILNPLMAGCIPIYLGAPDIHRYINPDCFVNVNDYPSLEACIDDLNELRQDMPRVRRMLEASCFTADFVQKQSSYIWGKGDFFTDTFARMPTPLLNNCHITRALPMSVIGLSFADGKNCTFDRILEEMETCGYFDRHHTFHRNRLSVEWLDKWGDFVNNNKRGYGYWLWKSYIIRTVLESVCDGDILVWLDSGMHIKPNCGAAVLTQYYQRLIASEHDVMSFEIKYEAAHWTKRDAMDIVCSRHKHARSAIARASPRQNCGGIMMFQKSAKSMEFVTEWETICHLEGGRYITDEPSRNGPEAPGFREHRHDQSIFSLLCKTLGSEVNLDNLSDDPHSDDMIFQPRRWIDSA